MTRNLRCTLSSPLAALAFAAIFIAATSARAQGYNNPPVETHQGIYFAGGIGAGLQIATGASTSGLGLQGNLRIGYSFVRTLQVYLEGDFSGSSQSGGTLTASDIMVGMRYFFFANHSLGVYGRAGLGLGIVGFSEGGISSSDLGVAELVAFGMEFRLGTGKWSLSPELFYRRTNESSADRVDTLGLGFLVNFN
jgi:hypothetical protein